MHLSVIRILRLGTAGSPSLSLSRRLVSLWEVPRPGLSGDFHECRILLVIYELVQVS